MWEAKSMTERINLLPDMLQGSRGPITSISSLALTVPMRGKICLNSPLSSRSHRAYVIASAIVPLDLPNPDQEKCL